MLTSMADHAPEPVVAHIGFGSIRSHLLLAGVWAVLLSLAFPQPGWGWLSHVALVPLVLLALRSTRPKAELEN